ncbi:hypothetical protein Sango_2105700 [Sesamum angolense]|uniref:Uncharacterized protein n=1 Tax=Sesamum angolense TaxID=2727404 RepID=A0AAE2BM56_9LAMI|nr:hypothetical protein Sango_2105700 [Sesamum angolense]
MIDNVTENVIDNVTENVTKIPVQNITKKGKRKLYERFLNESSSEFDDSSNEDYVQSGEESDSEAPSLVLEDIECDSNDEIFLSKDPSKKELIKKLKRVLKIKKNRQIPETRETESGKHEWASEDEIEDDLVSLEEGCRPIIGLDGCFLKIVYRGQLLVVVGRDGNDNMFPIAMAVVQVENRDTWGCHLVKRARLDDYVDDFYTNQMLLFMKKSHRDLKPLPLSQEQPSAKVAARGRRQSPQQQVSYQGPRNASLLGNINPATSSVPATRRYNKRPSISEVLDKIKERKEKTTGLVNMNACSFVNGLLCVNDLCFL